MRRGKGELTYHQMTCELKKVIAQYNKLKNDYNSLKEAHNKLLAEKGAPNEWVSVEERLPEPGERVLATGCGFVGEFYINKRGQWQRYNVNCSELLMALDILYWMPLPEPPGKEG